MLDYLKRDNKLFPVIIAVLFEEYQAKSGESVYFPRFLKGNVKL